VVLMGVWWGKGSQTRRSFLRAQRRSHKSIWRVVEFSVDTVKHGDYGAGVRMPVRQAVRLRRAMGTLTHVFQKLPFFWQELFLRGVSVYFPANSFFGTQFRYNQKGKPKTGINAICSLNTIF